MVPPRLFLDRPCGEAQVIQPLCDVCEKPACPRPGVSWQVDILMTVGHVAKDGQERGGPGRRPSRSQLLAEYTCKDHQRFKYALWCVHRSEEISQKTHAQQKGINLDVSQKRSHAIRHQVFFSKRNKQSYTPSTPPCRLHELLWPAATETNRGEAFATPKPATHRCSSMSSTSEKSTPLSSTSRLCTCKFQICFVGIRRSGPCRNQ